MNEVTLTITFSQGKPLQVTGPLQDKILCYGLLESARDAIKEFAPPAVIPAATIPNNHFAHRL